MYLRSMYNLGKKGCILQKVTVPLDKNTIREKIN